MLTRMGQKRDQVFNVAKAKSLKPKQGQRSSTVVVKIMYDLDPNVADLEGLGLWSAIINWKQGGIINDRFVAWELGDIVHQVYTQVYEKLIDLKGRVQEVDVIFKMPVSQDHKMTLSFKDAIKTLAS